MEPLEQVQLLSPPYQDTYNSESNHDSVSLVMEPQPSQHEQVHQLLDEAAIEVLPNQASVVQPIQIATKSLKSESASMIDPPPMFSDPLKHELEIIRKLTEQIIKEHEDEKLQLKSDFEKELEELHRKFDVKFQEVEVKFQQIKKNLDTRHNTVLAHKMLADALRSKYMEIEESGASALQQQGNLQAGVEISAPEPQSPYSSAWA